MPERYLLGVDIGTSVVKSVLFDLDGQERLVARRTPKIIRPHPHWSEVSMEALWQDVADTIAEIAATDMLRGGEILAIGLTGTACGLWLVDGLGEPVRHAILWNDGRAADILGQWLRDGRLDEVFRISGNAMFPGYTLPLLSWLQEHESDSLRRARRLLFCKDWIRYRLTGAIGTDCSDASYMPFDIRRGAYSEALLRLGQVQAALDLLPPVMEPEAVAGYLQPAAAERVGLPAGLPVIAGLVDVAAGTLGAGACQTGQACSIVGTSFMNNLVGEEPSFEPPGVGVQALTVGHLWIHSMANTAGTINLQWYLDQFCCDKKESEDAAGGSIYEWAERAAVAIPLGAGGIIYHPYLNTTGVVSPFVHPTARAQFFGLSIEHSRAHLLRAIYEGTALSMLDCYAHMGRDVDEILVVGGGARSPFWCQMFADCTGHTVTVPAGSEFGARGVAMLAGLASGAYRDLPTAMARMVRSERQHRPEPQATTKYARLYELYKNLYEHADDDWWQLHETLKGLEEGESR